MEKITKLSVEENKSTLFVGLVCLDIVNVMDFFPKEDIGQRCQDCLWQRGGNAGNSATVFSILGGQSGYFGTLSTSSHTVFLTDDLAKNKVSSEKCVTVQNTSCPISVVILNRSSGTRTVLHTNKDLREISFEDFTTRIDLLSAEIGWIHFEGRDNPSEIAKMLSYINDFNAQHLEDDSTSSKRVVTSLEAEKLRFAKYMDNFNLWSLPDVLFVSKDFARCQGYDDMTSAVQAYSKKVKDGAVVVCAWGEDGASAMCTDSGLVISPAFQPSQVIDTCGAGDTFNAAVIRALSQGKRLDDAVTFGCKVAGAKCGFQGFDEMKNIDYSLFHHN